MLCGRLYGSGGGPEGENGSVGGRWEPTGMSIGFEDGEGCGSAGTGVGSVVALDGGLCRDS